MKITLRTILAAMCLTGGFCVPWVAAEQTADPYEADRQILRAVLADIEAGINAPDLPRILAHLDDQVVVTYQNAHVARGKSEVEAYYSTMFSGPESPVKRLTTKAAIGGPAVFHDNTAVGYGTSVDHMELRTGRVIDLDAAWSATLVRKGNDWKVANLHFSTNVLDNAVLRSMRLWMTGIAVVGAVAGLVIGWWAARLRKR